MACEKHRSSMTELALGELHPRTERELLAHAAECAACRDAYNHAKEVRASLDRSIEALVAGEPSPHFASRLRARIAAERAPSLTPWLPWAPVAAGALALAVLAITLLLRTSHHGSPAFVEVARTAPAQVTPPNPAAGNVPPARVAVVPSTGSGTHGRAPSTPAHVRLLEPEVLVPPGQLVAALELREAVSTGRVDTDQLVKESREIGQPLEVKALEVSPLEKPAPLDDPAEHSGGF